VCLGCGAQITGKKVSLFNRPLHAPAALDEVAETADTLAANQQPLLLSKQSSAHYLAADCQRQASDPVPIQAARSSSG
jgi:hypothetical protein